MYSNIKRQISTRKKPWLILHQPNITAVISKCLESSYELHFSFDRHFTSLICSCLFDVSSFSLPGPARFGCWLTIQISCLHGLSSGVSLGSSCSASSGLCAWGLKPSTSWAQLGQSIPFRDLAPCSSLNKTLSYWFPTAVFPGHWWAPLSICSSAVSQRFQHFMLQIWALLLLRCWCCLKALNF